MFALVSGRSKCAQKIQIGQVPLVLLVVINVLAFDRQLLYNLDCSFSLCDFGFLC